MAKPLPPVVNGPITNISTQVYVDNVLPNSTVTVYNDAASTNVVGTATSTSPGSIWVPLTKPLSVGQPITARQLYTGTDPNIKVTGVSDPSNVSVPVLPVPVPLPSPVFVSGLCTCMDSVYIDGLIPGATLTIMMGTDTMVHAKITQTPQWFQLASFPIPTGAVLKAWQQVGISKSPTTPSLPIPVAAALGAPFITPPLRGCETNLDVSNLVPGADLKIINGASEAFITNPWDFYNLGPVPPLQPGPLTAQQYFTRCEQVKPGPIASFTVKKQAPEFPKVSYEPCADITQLTVSGLRAGEILTVEVSYSTKTGLVLESLGSQGVSGNPTVNLPKDWYPTDAVGPVTLRIEVMLCDIGLPNPGYTQVSVGQTGGPYPAPTLPSSLFDCARSVQVFGAHPGSQIQLFSDPKSPVARSTAVVATTADFVVELWTPLFTEEMIFVRQLGCKATGDSVPVKVKGVPDQLNPPSIVTPVSPSAESVQVIDVLAGAQVYLFVNGVMRSHIDAFRKWAFLSSGSPALAVGDKLETIQALCNEISGASTATVTPAATGIKQMLIIPIYWGEWWDPAKGNPYSWVDMNGLFQAVLSGRFMDGLNQYGIGRGFVSGHYVHPVDPPSTGFTDDMRDAIFRTAINDGHVGSPADYDLNTQLLFYCLMVKPGVEHLIGPTLTPDTNTGAYHYPFHAGYWDGGTLPGGEVCWVKSLSSSLGTLQRTIHEMAEAYSGAEISDKCQSAGLVVVNGILLPQYWSAVDSKCWPPGDGI